MKFRVDNSNSSRSSAGSVLPVFVVAFAVAFAFMALVFDVMREFYCAEKLAFAAQCAALDVLPFACQDGTGKTNNISLCQADGSFTDVTRSRLQQALERTSGANAQEWNLAPSASALDKPINIDSQDLVSASAADSGSQIADHKELVLQVRARRAGNDALTMFFLPLLYAGVGVLGQSVPAAVYNNELFAAAEACGQPASRIGAGASPASSGDSKAAEIWRGRLACLPLALEATDFESSTAASNQAVSVDVKAVSPGAVSTSGFLRGYFINLAGGSVVNSYYRDAASAAEMDNLVGLWHYFDRSESGPTVIPQAVERGVLVDRFDNSSTSFNNEQLRSALSAIASGGLDRCYIVPVVESRAGSICRVLGFAWLKLQALSEPVPGEFQFRFRADESIVVLNASCSGGLKSIPFVNGERLPAPPANGPFASRAAGSTGIPRRPKGVALAPALSCRLAPSQSLSL